MMDIGLVAFFLMVYLPDFLEILDLKMSWEMALPFTIENFSRIGIL